MITKEYGQTVLVCDRCRYSKSFDDFESAVNYAKEEGWGRYQENNLEDTCLECTEMYI